MAYLRSRYRSGLGAVAAQKPDPKRATNSQSLADKAKSIIAALQSDTSSVVDTLGLIVQDPALPEVSCMVGQLYAIENKLPVVPCPSMKRSTKPGGIGLRKAVPAMRAWVFAEQNPWVKPAAILALFGLPVLLGYEIGRRRR